MSLYKLKRWISSSTQSTLARNALWMLLAQGIRLVIQASYFIIVARTLGVEEYGAFVGVGALTAILAPFVSGGRGDLLIKNSSRDRSLFSEYWGNSLLVITVSGFIFTAIAIALSRIIFPSTIPSSVVFLVCLSDLFFLRLLDVSGQAFQSVQLLKRTAQINIVFSATRLLAALLFISFFHNPGIAEWSVLYFLSAAIPATAAVLLVNQTLDSPKFSVSRIRSEFKEGLYFSTSLSAQSIYNDIDKTMLARFSTLEATGIYAAAYRLIDVAFIPVRSLLYASYAKFFQQGSKGIAGTIELTKRLLPLASIYGLGASICLLGFAPVIPLLLGSDFGQTVEALKWLAPIVLLKTLHYFAADTLTGAGFQGLRTGAQIFVAIFNILINLWLLPLFSWRGAAWSSLLSDALLMVCLWSILTFMYRKQSKIVGG